MPSDLVLQAVEKVQARLYAQVFAIYNIIAAILLMKYYGILGVAYATGSALMFKCVFYYYMARRYTSIAICWGSLFRISANSVFAGAALLIVKSLGDSNWYLFGSLAVGGMTYIVMTIVNNFMDSNEKDLVNKLLKRRVFSV